MFKKKYFRENDNKFWSILLFIALGFFATKCVSVALTEVFSFDGGITAQVAQNLAEDFQYRTSFDQGKLFDSIISTGAPVIVPLAISFRIFRESFASGLMINAIYLILFMLASAFYLIRCLKVHRVLVLLLIVLLLGTPRLNEFGFGLYGEIPMLFYLMLFLIFLHQYRATSQVKYLFISGIFLGFGLLTKTIILISVPAMIFSFAFSYLTNHKEENKNESNIHQIFQDVGSLLTGFLIPIITFEIIKLLSLGYQRYIQIIQAKINFIFTHPGLTQSDSTTGGILSKYSRHMEVLSKYLRLPAFLVVLILLFIISFLVIYLYLRTTKRIRADCFLPTHFYYEDFPILLITTLSFFGWWLLITELAWERYIFSGYILLEICLVIVLNIGINYVSKVDRQKDSLLGPIRVGIIVFSILILLIGGAQLIISGNYLIGFKDSREKEAYLKAGDFIQALPPDAEIFGYGWWEAPVLSFTSGKKFNNILNNYAVFEHKTFNDTYFVYDFYAYYLDPGGNELILEDFEYQIVFQDEYSKLFIYKILSRSLFSYDEFNKTEKSEVSYSKINFAEELLEAITRNVYIEEKNPYGKWAETESAYLLRYKNEEKLRIDLWFDEINNYRQIPINLDIYFNRNHISTNNITESGSISYFIPIKDVTSDYLELTIICNTTLFVEDDGRPLAFLIQNIELINE